MNKITEKPEILFSLYAALISTIALLWNIINSIRDKTSRIDVTAEFLTSMVIGGREFEQGPGSLKISVVNKSKRIKYIKTPQLKLSYEHGFNDGNSEMPKDIVNLYRINNKQVFPLEMKPETEIILSYPFAGETEWMLKNARNTDKFKIIIVDTTGKKYKSKSMPIQTLINCVNHNKKINPALLNAID